MSDSSSVPLRQRILPPILAWLLADCLTVMVALHQNHDPEAAATYCRWDSFNYMGIALRGYEIHRCGENDLYGRHGIDWCGNVGWFPGYPILIRLGVECGLHHTQAALLTTQVFWLGCFLLLWFGFLDGRNTPANMRTLLLFALFPGSIYTRVAFPISMTLFFLLLSLWGARRDAWAVSGLAGGAAAFTYHLGVLQVGVLGLWLLLRTDLTPHQRLRAILIAPGPVLGGFLAVLAVFHVTTGYWNAWFLLQDRYGHGLSNPYRVIEFFVARIAAPSARAAHFSSDAQFLFLILLTVSVWVGAIVRRADWDRTTTLLLIFVTTYWFFPVMMGVGVGFYRTAALLAPAVLLMRAWSPNVIGPLSAFLAILLTLQSIRFFDGTLV